MRGGAVRESLSGGCARTAGRPSARTVRVVGWPGRRLRSERSGDALPWWARACRVGASVRGPSSIG